MNAIDLETLVQLCPAFSVDYTQSYIAPVFSFSISPKRILFEYDSVVDKETKEKIVREELKMKVLSPEP